MVGHAGSPIYVLRMLIWPWPDPGSRSKSLTFWSSENSTFLRLSRLPFWRRAQNWWMITTVWSLVYSFLNQISEFLSHLAVTWLPSSLNVDITSTEHLLGIICPLPEASCLWLWLKVGLNKQCMLAAVTISPLPWLFMVALCNRADHNIFIL